MMTSVFRTPSLARCFALAASALVVALSACSGEDSGGQTQQDTAPETTPQPEVSNETVDFFDVGDGSSPDTSAPVLDCEADPGAPLCPCRVNDDCNTGYCVPSRDGGTVCTDFCISECPEGWDCRFIQFPGSDPTFLCVQLGLNLCRPCTQDSQCQTGPASGSGDRCVHRGDLEGSFCGTACVDDRDCPAAYACREVTTLEGGQTVRQCVLADEAAECDCSGRAIEENAMTACNDQTCTGVRVCEPGGLTACDAEEWGPEVCDGTDNNCNGLTDEGFPDTDNDGVADCVDPDIDGDGIPNEEDNCPFDYNPDQQDSNGNGIGDVCDDALPAPTLLRTEPASPSAEPEPVVHGTTDRPATVSLYDNPSCSGEPIGSGQTDADNAFAIPASVAANATTVIHGQATDEGGNTSECSSASLTYVHDDIPPAPPVLTGTSPASPSRTSTSPTIEGTVAEAGLAIALYATDDCSGPVIAETTAAVDAFSAGVTVQANTTTAFSATATDAAGNVSACSEPLPYTHDNIAPETPLITGSTPTSPSNSSTTPQLSGQAEAFATVAIFRNAACTGAAHATTTASAGGTFSAPATAQANATTTFHAQATDAAGNVSGCSPAFAYIHTDAAPDAPVLTGTSPASPSNNQLSPSVLGTLAGTGLTLRIFTNGACSGTPAQTVASAPTSFSVQVTVPANTTTTFTAQTTDAAGNVSACSNAITYTHDNQAPPNPAITASNPTSPSRTSTTPTLSGTAEAQSTVRLYTGTNCAGSIVAQTTATPTGTFSVQVTVTANTTTTFFARAVDAAGNVSGCSAGFPYTHDNVAPTAPVLTGTNPTSPSNTSTNPTVNGTVGEPSLTVRVYRSANCSGAIASQSQLASTSFAIATSVTANSTTSFSANAVDAAGNVSGCSNSISYTHDNVAPQAPVIVSSNPVSPSRTSTTPQLSGTTSEGGVTVRMFTNASCTGSPIATGTATASSTFTIQVTAGANTTTTFYANARDAAGNTSGCSAGFAYIHDNVAPVAPVLTGTSPASPSNASTNPNVNGTVGESGLTVRIYRSANCSGTVASQSQLSGTSFGIATTVTANTTTSFSANAVDAAGNVSGCSNSITYTHDNVAPAAPVLTGTTPASPSNASTNPKVNGTVGEAGLTVRIYRSTNCSGAIASQSQLASTSFGIATTVTANTTTSFSANAVDAAGNASGCSNSISYTHDNIAPLPPVIVSSNPASPSRTSTTPQLSGTTSEAGVTVRMFTNASCTGSPIATGTATAGSTFTIQVTAGANTTTTFYANARDAAGNTSGCSDGFAYIHDNIPPPAPVLTGFNPATPSTTISGTRALGTQAEATARVILYPSASCTGTAFNPSGQVATNNTFDIPFTAQNLGCTAVSARAVDAAGNQSGCSNSLTFAHYGCGQCPCPGEDWIRQLGTPAADSGRASATDSLGNAYLVGDTGASLNGQPHAGGIDAYIAKYSPTGALLWTRQLGTALTDRATAVTVDGSNNVYVAGMTQGDIDGQGTTVPDCPQASGAECGDAWIAKYNTSGTRLWLRRYRQARRESVPDIEWDAANSRVLMLITSINVPSASGISPQVVAVNPSNGNFTNVWDFINDSQNKNPAGLAVDGSGNFYVHGRCQFTIAGALSTTGSGGNGMNYLYKINAAGTEQWVQHWGSPAHDIAGDLAVDASGNIYASGYLQGDIEGTGAMGNPYRGADGTNWNGWGDAALVKFNASGAQQWAWLFGTERNDLITSVWIAGTRVYVAGATAGNAETGASTSKYGGSDLFVAWIGTDGRLAQNYLRQFGTAGNDTIGRSSLRGGVWHLAASSMADWTGLSRDACTYGGNGDAALVRFCAQPLVIVNPDF